MENTRNSREGTWGLLSRGPQACAKVRQAVAKHRDYMGVVHQLEQLNLPYSSLPHREAVNAVCIRGDSVSLHSKRPLRINFNRSADICSSSFRIHANKNGRFILFALLIYAIGEAICPSRKCGIRDVVRCRALGTGTRRGGCHVEMIHVILIVNYTLCSSENLKESMNNVITENGPEYLPQRNSSISLKSLAHKNIPFQLIHFLNSRMQSNTNIVCHYMEWMGQCLFQEYG